MKSAGEFIVRHRRLLLIALLTVTLLVSSSANRRRLEEEAIMTSMPVIRTNESSATAVAAYISDRDAIYQRDVEALSALISRQDLDERTLHSAALQLQALIHHREARDAIEEALATTSLAPCAALVTDGAVTLVTAKAAPTAEDSALVLTLASIHAGINPEDVRIITAE